MNKQLTTLVSSKFKKKKQCCPQDTSAAHQTAGCFCVHLHRTGGMRLGVVLNFLLQDCQLVTLREKQTGSGASTQQDLQNQSNVE